jgi:hypothetical protein
MAGAAAEGFSFSYHIVPYSEHLSTSYYCTTLAKYL